MFNKSAKKFAIWLDIVTDILFVPVMILVVFTGIAISNVMKTNAVPNMFGYSVVKILSDSMVNSGFNKGDLVALKSINVGELKVGDTIAFYYYNLSGELKPLNLPIYDENTAHLRTKEHRNSSFFGLSSPQIFEAAKRGTKVYFHQIADIRIAPDGILWFRTWGTSNLKSDGSPDYDARWIREDLIVGKHIEAPALVMDALVFVSSTKGIVALVIIPCGILLTMLVFSLMEILDQLAYEKMVLKRKMLLTDPILNGKDIGYEMREKDKQKVLSYADESEVELYKSLLYRPKKEKTRKNEE